MQAVTVRLTESVSVRRYVCNRGHPHPTYAGAVACEAARAEGSNDTQLEALFDAEVEEFNA